MPRKYKTPREKYCFDMIIGPGDYIKMTFTTYNDAVLARSAAHMHASKSGATFRTRMRETDAGMIELTIIRML